MRSRLVGKHIFVSIDESTDKMKRSIVNVIVGQLGDTPTTPFLFDVALVEQVDNTSMCHVFSAAMSKLYGKDIQYTKVLLFVTDGAAYMRKAAETLRGLYPKMVHLTCIAHGFHRVAEEIREQYADVDKLISSTKKVFKKSPHRTSTFKRLQPDVPLPPEPVLTRWGTWLEAVAYYSTHIDAVSLVLKELDATDAVAIRTAKSVCERPDVRNDLAYIQANFGFIPGLISACEKRGAALSDGIRRIDEAVGLLRGAEGTIGDRVQEKLDSVLEKNGGLVTLRQISAVLCGNHDQGIEGYKFSPIEMCAFMYAPLVSCDVERSFSRFKAVLRDNRESFKFENLKQHLIIHCNDA